MKQGSFVLYKEDTGLNVFQVQEIVEKENLCIVKFVETFIEPAPHKENKYLISNDNVIEITNDYIEEKLKFLEAMKAKDLWPKTQKKSLVLVQNSHCLYEIVNSEKLYYEKDYPRIKIKKGDFRDEIYNLIPTYNCRLENVLNNIDENQVQYSTKSLKEITEDFFASRMEAWNKIKDLIKSTASNTETRAETKTEDKKEVKVENKDSGGNIKEKIIKSIENRMAKIQEEKNFLSEILDDIKKI